MEDPINSEPEFGHDELLGQIQARSGEEYARQSDAGESAAKLTEFLNETGMNGQAFSWLKSIVKKLPKKNGQQKAMDVIRSLKMGLPMVEAHVQGQGTGELGLGDPADFEEDGEDLDPDPDWGEGDDDEIEIPMGDEVPAGDAELAEEAAEFEAHLAELETEDTKVTPIKGKRGGAKK
ncbi:hypothetical protein KM176_16610 [Pseudooceanicola sp. CBS1P-1]|uniref:Uncharacterized protein n=1 Tax=Pseudooceanicola albus TaxID=2692189 RepID=A0A6L7G728_9RHOB|nr:MULTISPECIES: hypothetical protein [Pseudooceanicola]MBT9385498.1 hypothetical protein [Pseudooceanicola endophyticus]MXN19090.1 hypothetical protein [Pseudooceanicola albus]